MSLTDKDSSSQHGPTQAKKIRLSSDVLEVSDAPNQKEGRIEGSVNKVTSSPFESFVQIAANMPNVWMNIMDNLSATEVATCLKTCKGLRVAISQCLNTNTRFKRKMDVAATASAISRGRVQYRIQTQLKENHYQASMISAIDDVWYCTTADNFWIDMHKHDLESGMMDESTLPIRWSLSRLKLYPSLEREKYFFDEEKMLALVDFNTIDSKALNFHPMPSIQDIGLSYQCMSIVRYRISIHGYGSGTEGGTTIWMHISKGKKKQGNRVTLYEGHQTVRHVENMPSNEEAKMVVMVPNVFAVYDTATGDIIWQKATRTIRHSHKYKISLFITKQVAGCCFQNSETATLTIFNTINGKKIEKVKIKSLKNDQKSKKNVICAKGPYICYTNGLVINVIFVTGRETKKFSFPIPMDLLKATKRLTNAQEDTMYDGMVLWGFVGKSFVLIGKLKKSYGHCYPLMFTLDLDMAINAKNEEETNLAFSVPLDFNSMENPHNEFDIYQPVYKTDRINECVDLVGIMRVCPPFADSPSPGKCTLESYQLVTHMDSPIQ